jgi:molybdate transport system substrate-binding protein
MRTRRCSGVVPVLAGLVLVLSGCSSSSSSKPSRSAASTAAVPSTTATPFGGSLTVFAAASLTGAFNAAKTTLTIANPGLSLTNNFAGSNTLVSQIQQGAPADVFASADTKNMQRLIDARLVEAPVTFAKNKLEIAVAAGNPKNISGLADLARPGVTVVLEAVGVPAGDYTRGVLGAKNITVAPKSLETDVKSALAKVTSGEADATVVYVTDVVAAGSKVAGVTIPTADQPSITYPIAVVKATKNHAAAQAFVDSAVSGDVQRALEAAGFLAPQ